MGRRLGDDPLPQDNDPSGTALTIFSSVEVMI
jgi:hypothetical protein